jgi:hypothetical protein
LAALTRYSNVARDAGRLPHRASGRWRAGMVGRAAAAPAAHDPCVLGCGRSRRLRPFVRPPAGAATPHPSDQRDR